MSHVATTCIAIHGGCGDITRETLGEELAQQYREALRQAVCLGQAELHRGAAALDAVAAAVRSMEDDPLFNAGRGSVYSHDGQVELDASIMDGATLRAGAVCAVRGIANPVDLARRVMDRSRHVMLSGEGAQQFAREQGMRVMPAEYFHTERRWQELQQALHLLRDGKAPSIFGTVGAVALDRHGNLAAATSTGGMTAKQYGRIGDSPIIGAGTYADNAACAVSATGHGEFFIRMAAAHDICSRMRHGRRDLHASVEEVIKGRLADLGGQGGVVAVDRFGHIAMVHNSPGMFRACADPQGRVRVAIFRDETNPPPPADGEQG